MFSKQLVLHYLLVFALLTGVGACSNSTTLPDTPTSTLTPIYASSENILETKTPTPIPTTATPSPTMEELTPTPIPEDVILVPRYMLPPRALKIYFAKCNYQGDIWAEKAAYIAYTCPGMNITWLSARFVNLDEGETAADLFGQTPSESNSGGISSRIRLGDLYGEQPVEAVLEITPGTLLSKYENITILGKKENSEYIYYMLYETERYAISSEMFFPALTSTLEEYYAKNGEKVFSTLLEVMLENVKSDAVVLQPTPMPDTQQILYDQLAPWLVTTAEANEFYQGAPDMWGDPFDGSWALLEDETDIERESVCRKFEDRSNADAPLVTFWNCVYTREPGYELSKLQDSFPRSDVLKSAFEYPDQTVIYGDGLSSGQTSLNAFVLQDNYLIYVFVVSRTLMGQEPEDVFEGFTDAFIHKVLMINLERYDH